MTLIIGIKCTDGIVIGADGGATLGASLGPSTVIQPISKLRYFENRMIMGVSGPVGLGQLFFESVPEAMLHRHRGPQGPNAAQVMKLLKQTIYGDVEPALKSAQESAPVVGNQNAFAPVNNSSLVALPIQGVPTLIQCDSVGNPEMASEDLPIVAIGSGQKLADPFLAFLRRVFWAEKPLTITDGIFATVWTLLHVLEVEPGLGLSEPIEVGFLRVENGSPVAVKLSQDELGEYRQYVAEAEKHLAEFPIHSFSSPTELPEPPSAGE